MTTRRWQLVVLFVGVLLVAGTTVVLLGRHWLEDWNDEIDRRWMPLRPALDTRYERLAALDSAFRDEYGGARRFNREIERLLHRWDRLMAQDDIEQESEVDTANALELAARRLIVSTQRSTERRPSEELLTATMTFARSLVPSPELPRYNRATAEYERTRDSVLGAPAAHLLAYYGRSPLGLTLL